MNTLLEKAFNELPISALITTTDGTIVAMNQTAFITFTNKLSVNDNLVLKLGQEEGQQIINDDEGIFELNNRVFRFHSSNLTFEKETYLNICMFDFTIAHQRALNAEMIANHTKDVVDSYRTRPELEGDQQPVPVDMEKFEVS